MPQSSPPDPIRRFVERCLPADGPVPRQVLLQQEGEMWQKPGARPMRFTAFERLAVDEVAFSWRARFRLAGPFGVNVVDGYAGGEGMLEARLLGLPLQRQRGPETSAGEALRYLAELPWAPHAMTRNADLKWRAIGAHAVEVGAQVGRDLLTVTLELDADGDIVRSLSQARLRKTSAGWRPTPWGGELGDYEVLGGVRIPTSAEVFWELGSERFVYWRGRVTALELLDRPFEPVRR